MKKIKIITISYMILIFFLVGSASASLPVFTNNNSPAMNASILNQIVNSFNSKGLNVLDYGAVADDSTDNTAAFQNAINAAMAKGTPLYVPAGTYLIKGQLIIPNDGSATNPKQRPLKIIGAGFSDSCMYGGGAFSYGGSTLDMRYSGSYGKIVTNGYGLLDIEGVTFSDTTGVDNTPFIYDTSTTLHLIGNAFIGGKAPNIADQDAVVLGGRGTAAMTVATQALTDGFQGYGTVIEKNYFSYIRRMVYCGNFVNGIVIRDNAAWFCGTNLANGGCIEFDQGNSLYGNGQPQEGNLVEGNVIEVTNYPYAIVVHSGFHNNFIANNFYDIGSKTLSFYYFGEVAYSNTIIAGAYDSSKHLVAEMYPSYNIIVDPILGRITCPSIYTSRANGVQVGYFFGGGNGIYSGSGSPNSVVNATIGSMYLRSDGGTGTTLYIKESGTGNTGWISK